MTDWTDKGWLDRDIARYDRNHGIETIESLRAKLAQAERRIKELEAKLEKLFQPAV